MKRSIILFVILALLSKLHAQEDISLKEHVGIAINPIGIEIFYEKPLGKSILTELAIGYKNITYVDENNFSLVGTEFNPHSRLSLRWVYNRAKRTRKKKVLKYNLGNFIGIQNKVIYNLNNERDDILYMLNDIHWGMQKELNNRYAFLFQVGYGLYSTKLINRPSITFRFNFKYYIF